MSCCRSAEASYKQTLAINENALGKEHPLVAKVLHPTLCLNYILVHYTHAMTMARDVIIVICFVV